MLSRIKKSVFFTEKNTHLRKLFWLFVLVICGLIYYNLYVFSVIPPQTGWWQYMAQRLSEGELLYRDVFMYVPPYFTWLTTGLYQVFGTNFVAYTVFGLIFFRVIPWVLCYLIITRFVHPAVSAWTVLVGVCLTSAYLMDQAYDYNPMIMGLVIVQAYLLIRIYEGDSSRTISILVFFEGILCGIQLMMKQNVGIVMPIVIIVILCYAFWVKKSKKNLFFIISKCLAGILVAILPGFIYLFVTETVDDFWRCITVALTAKVGEGNIFLVAVQNFVRTEDLIVACLFAIFLACLLSKKPSRKRIAAPIAIIATFAATLFYGGYINFAIDYFQNFSLMALILVLLFFALLLTGVLCFFFVGKIRKLSIILSSITFFCIFLFLTFILPSVSNNFAEYFVFALDWSSIKSHILYLFLYIDIFLWMRSIYLSIGRKDEKQTKFLIVYTIFMGFMAVSFASAVLEELYALLLVPGVFCVVSDSIEEMRGEGSSYKISSSVMVFSTIIMSLFICSLSLIQKMYVPYEWHSWRSTSILSDNTILDLDINGLEGFKLPSNDANTYTEIVKLITENSDEDSILYQFPNIPLFNVLTNRKSLYAAIPYFDVCPDLLALESAEQLHENPPTLFLWANLSEGRWNLHEEIFRDGKVSGQRAIQEFYNTVVQEQYTLLGAFDNNEGETIELWCKSKE